MRAADVLQKGDQFSTLLSRILIFLSSCALVLLIVIFGWLVFGRYVLNVTPTWVEQLALVLICYITFLGAAVGIQEETHLGVTFIREAMPTPLRNLLRIAGNIILAIFGIVMFLACLELVQFGWSTKLPMLNVPEGVRTLPAAICGGLIFIFSSLRAISRIHEYYFATTRSETEAD